MSQPLHQRIRAEIEAAILSGALRAGERLPTEHALMARYGCARMTVNKALSALAAAGLVERRKRAGTVVARPRVHSMVFDVPDLEQEVMGRGQRYRFQLCRQTVRKADPAKAEEVDLAGSGDLLVIEGVHLADDQPLAFEERLVSLAAVPAMADQPFTSSAPGTWLLRHVPWTEAESRIAAVSASRTVADRLRIPPGSPCLYIERSTWQGHAGVTIVHQHFVGSAYDLVARFGTGQAVSGGAGPRRTTQLP